MVTAENIAGKKLNGIIGQLNRKRTILRLNLLGKDYEGLTIITNIIEAKGNSSFMIDFPGGAGDIFSGTEGDRIFFDFSGEDKLQYTFRTVVEKVLEDEIQLRFPESIERIQRRKHFRVTSLSGTIFLLQANQGVLELNVMNISQGGALINQGSRYHDKELFFEGSILTHIRIMASKGSGGDVINIKKAEIRRIEKKPLTDKYQYAIKFLELSKRDDSLINNFIYQCQREILKTRSYMTGG